MNDHKEAMGRRRLLGGAATLGAAAAAVAWMPAKAPAPSAVNQKAASPEKNSSGYRVTEHVRAYYASARV